MQCEKDNNFLLLGCVVSTDNLLIFFCARVRIAHCCFWLGLMQLKLAEFQTQFSKRKWFMKNSHNLLSVWSATRGKQLNNENFTNGMHMIGSVRKTARFSFLWNTVRMCVVCLCARYKWAVSLVGAEKSNGYEHLLGIFSSDQSFWNRATKFSHYSCAPLSGFNDYEPHTHTFAWPHMSIVLSMPLLTICNASQTNARIYPWMSNQKMHATAFRLHFFHISFCTHSKYSLFNFSYRFRIFESGICFGFHFVLSLGHFILT